MKSTGNSGLSPIVNQKQMRTPPKSTHAMPVARWHRNTTCLRGSLSRVSGLALALCLAAAWLPRTALAACTYGPEQCKPDFVWRAAFAGDKVCVSGKVRTQFAQDNAQAAQRRAPSGAYGPNTCTTGYVWREAGSNDQVCVTGAVRGQAAADNAQAAARRDPACAVATPPITVTSPSTGVIVTSRSTGSVAGADLVIDAMDLVIPRLPLGGVETKLLGRVAPSLPRSEVEGERVTIEGLQVRVRVTNRGGERWAQRGEVGFLLTAGAPDDAARAPGGGVGVSVVAEGPLFSAPFGPFRARATIPGSLAPGESRVITATMTTTNDRSRMFFERDKYYTVIASIRARGQSDETNDRSQRVGRFVIDHSGGLVVTWEPLEILAQSAGTVQVNAPPGRRP